MKWYLFAVITFAVLSVKSQHMLYTDVYPDKVVYTGDSFLLDLNNDGYKDFKIFQYSQLILPAYDMVGVRCKWKNQVTGDVDSIYFYPKKLSFGASIDSTLVSWKSDVGFGMSMNYLTTAKDYGNWQGGVTNKFLGLRILFWAKYYYGWVRLDVAANAKSFTVRDYAMDTIPNEKTTAGAGMPVSIFSNEKNSGFIAYLSANQLIIDTRPVNLDHFTLLIYNLNGQEVINKVINSNYLPVDISSLKNGLYLVKIISEKESYNFKIEKR
jgi:hypothetical protein